MDTETTTPSVDVGFSLKPSFLSLTPPGPYAGLGPGSLRRTNGGRLKRSQGGNDADSPAAANPGLSAVPRRPRDFHLSISLRCYIPTPGEHSRSPVSCRPGPPRHNRLTGSDAANRSGRESAGVRCLCCSFCSRPPTHTEPHPTASETSRGAQTPSFIRPASGQRYRCEVRALGSLLG